MTSHIAGSLTPWPSLFDFLLFRKISVSPDGRRFSPIIPKLQLRTYFFERQCFRNNICIQMQYFQQPLTHLFWLCSIIPQLIKFQFLKLRSHVYNKTTFKCIYKNLKIACSISVTLHLYTMVFKYIKSMIKTITLTSLIYLNSKSRLLFLSNNNLLIY